MPCYFRATAMARVGLVEAVLCCYFADSDADPPLRLTVDSDIGGMYEVHASVLRGARLCGGPLGIPAAASC
jgi:hypothetical protein